MVRPIVLVFLFLFCFCFFKCNHAYVEAPMPKKARTGKKGAAKEKEEGVVQDTESMYFDPKYSFHCLQ
jgi:hypothetical protein